MKHWFSCLLLAVGINSTCVAVSARETETMSHPQIMLLGSYHLANNNRDVINVPIEDVLTAHRQQQIIGLVECLAQWKPTRIAVEWDRSDQAGLDSRYATLLAGNYEPTSNEIDQIGLRLAKQLGHDRVYAVDWNEAAPGDQVHYDFFGWADRNNQESRLKAFVDAGQKDANSASATMRGQSVSEWYHDLNGPDARLKMHKPYFEIATFGSNEDNPGAAWVGAWYARNLRIFNNIREILAPQERVLVLYGAGHVHLLDQFFRESGTAIAVDPRPFIKCE
jgi:hypothetical protein